MHRSHLSLCGIGIALALGYLAVTGGSASGVGLLIAALLCPLAMVLAMTVLMGHRPDRAEDGTDQPVTPVEQR